MGQAVLQKLFPKSLNYQVGIFFVIDRSLWFQFSDFEYIPPFICLFLDSIDTVKDLLLSQMKVPFFVLITLN